MSNLEHNYTSEYDAEQDVLDLLDIINSSAEYTVNLPEKVIEEIFNLNQII